MKKMLIIYDIASDKIRRKIVRCLESYGVRVQYSAFECDLNCTMYNKLATELIKLTSGKGNCNIRMYMTDKGENLCGEERSVNSPTNVQNNIWVFT